jgi:hypothetical protein
VRPISGKAAEQLAAELGFERRSETGLSVMIVDPHVDESALIEGVMTHWWPAIEDQVLRVKVNLSNGETRVPNPKSRPDLRPYIRAFRLATGAVEATSDQELHHFFRKHRMGTIGAVAANELTPDEEIPAKVPQNCIALIRGSRMVVAYMQGSSRSTVDFHAVFVADPSTEEIFRMAEPPSHDRWEDDPRLDSLDDPVFARHIIASYKNELKQRLKLWLGPLRPKLEQSFDRIPELDSILAKHLTSKKSGPPVGPTKATSPLRYSVIHSPIIDSGGQRQTMIAAELSLDANYTGNSLSFKARPKCHALVDRALVKDSEEIGLCRFSVQPESAVKSTNGSEYVIEITHNQSLSVEAVSNTFDPNLIVEIELNLESLD